MINVYRNNEDRICKANVYDRKADSYEMLPWTQDISLFSVIFKDLNRYKCYQGGIVDLGCGPATLGKFVAEYLRIPYLGIEKSKKMYERAKSNLFILPNTAVICGDFTKWELPKDKLLSNVIVMKNILHLFSDYMGVVFQTISNFPNARHLLVVETVSPSLDSLEWMQGLYLRLGLDYKEHWFIKDSLAQAFKAKGLRCMRNEYHSQYIDVNKWLASFGLSQEAISLAESYIEDAPDKIRKEMAVNRDLRGKITMLRLQNILEIKIS